MNLIEQLGLEKCKQIVDGAFKRAVVYDTVLDECFYYACPCCADDQINLDDLRTAIADHGTPTNKGTDNLSHFDHCTDIANHISPLTKVTER